MRVAADGTYVEQPFGSGYMDTIGQDSVGTVTVDGSRYWTGLNTQKPLAALAPGDTALTQVAALASGTIRPRALTSSTATCSTRRSPASTG